MSEQNGAAPAAIDPADFIERELNKIREEEGLDLATDAELGLPDAYEDEVAAGIGLEHVDSLMTVRWKILNAKLNHKDDEVEKLTAQELASRNILTRIKRERPRAYAIVQWALAKRAENAARERKKADQQAAQPAG